jgi:RNA polymerase sigma factor (sigma-70 family)
MSAKAKTASKQAKVSAKKAAAKKPATKKAASAKAAQVKKAPAKAVKSAAPKAKAKASSPKKMPAAAEMKNLKAADEGFMLASTDAAKFLQSRQQAVYNIARRYHLDPDDVFQESFEVLLTCLRDYQPVYENSKGELMSVKFTTFFGSRLENKAMELRNGDPEYQARQSVTDNMSDEEKARFKEDPPLLVQHLDLESQAQEHLRGEVSSARLADKTNPALRIARDSFFEQKLSELVAKEKDEKKRAILLHVKVGGVFNFQEIAYHFGVTDSRASQVLNELMDAFYVQRLIEGSLSSVAYDFKKLKFNEKRAQRLILESLENAAAERQAQILATFNEAFPELEEVAKKRLEKLADKRAHEPVKGTDREQRLSSIKPPPIAYEKILTAEENKKFPLVEVASRPLSTLKSLNAPYATPRTVHEEELFRKEFNVTLSADYPVLVTEDGYVIDGWRRVEAARAAGQDDQLCIVRHVPSVEDAKILRVSLNLRLNQPDKLDLYYAICTLADVGLSQQKIADAIGLSRTNVLVYCKVKDKAAPKLRALFEDGLIQITNAASCIDLSDKVQEELAEFIRKYGGQWSKGTKFNDLFKAAKKGKIAELAADLKPEALRATPNTLAESASALANTSVGGADVALVSSLQKRVNDYEQALQDSEVWLAQREQVITNQTDALTDAQAEIEQLKKELQAAELIKFGDEKTLKAELKQMKDFYALVERLAGAKQAVQTANKALQANQSLRRGQWLEIQQLHDDLAELVESLRISLHTKRAVAGL